MYSQCGLSYGICGIDLVGMCRKTGRKGERRRKEKEIGVGRKVGRQEGRRKEREQGGEQGRKREGRRKEGGKERRREGSKRKEVGNFGRKGERKKEEERREEGRMEEGKRNVPLNSWLRSAPPELSQPDLELKCGSLRAPEAEPVLFTSCPSWNSDIPKVGVWDLGPSLSVEEPGLQSLLTWNYFHRLSGKHSE